MSSKKIWQYPEATSITNDDYILMDSNTETGSQCLKANKIGAVHITKTVTERKVYKASDDNANGFSEVTVAVPYTDVHYDKDDIVSFIGENLPLKSVTAYIEPQQDLHGYDAPWAGGAGKNKLRINSFNSTTQNGVTFTYDNGVINANGTATNDIIFVLPLIGTTTNYTTIDNIVDGIIADTNYILTGCTNGTPQTYWIQILISGSGSEPANYNNPATFSFTAEQIASQQRQIAIRVKNGTQMNNVKFYPMIRLASVTDATFAPYSNICPISGWSGANVTRTGKNLWGGEKLAEDIVAKVPNATKDTTNKTVTYAASNIRNVILFDKFKTNTQYSFLLSSESSFTNIAVTYTDETQAVIVPNQIFISDASKSVEKLSGIWSSGTTILKYEDCGVFEGVLTASDFEPYNGHTYTIDLDGTRYGGELDVVSGVLTVDRAYVDMGTLSWRKETWGSGVDFYASLANAKLPLDDNTKGNIISSQYETLTKKQIYNSTDDGISLLPSGYLTVRDSRYVEDTETNFKTAMNGVQLVYELATPLTIQLTPTQVNSLMGVNNIWADTGEIAVEWQTLYVTPTT